MPELTASPLPPRQRPLSHIEQSHLDAQVATWLTDGIIEPRPTQPINNNLVFVAKKDGSIRVCDDCTPVNLVTKDYDWPLPRLQDIRHKISGSKWFTRLDLKDAFFRIKIPVKYRFLTSFTSRGQQYQFRRMVWGLKTAPAIFQEFMDTHLAEFSRWAFWYIDDILIHSENKNELRGLVARMKAKLHSMKCQVNETKSEYEKQGLLFAGLYLFPSGVGPNLLKLKELICIPPPTTKKDMQSGLGLVSYLRDFIPLVSHFSAHLYPSQATRTLSDMDYKVEWGKLIRHIQSAANTTRHWVENEPADLYTDASGVSLGVILLQKGRVVAVSSRKLTSAETRYSATDREHLALVHAAKKFKIFLHRQGAQTQVWTDHEALLSRKDENLTPRQARWLELTKQWIPNARHVKGKLNPADIISRWPVEIYGGAVKL